MKNIPRWRHKCPACNRIIFWEKVYCMPCIKAVPERDRFRLTALNSSYRKEILLGTNTSRKHLYAVINSRTLCVECGNKMNGHGLDHRCNALPDTHVRTRSSITCRACHRKKSKNHFPSIRRGRYHLRTRICAECLIGKPIVLRTKQHAVTV